MNKYVNKDIEQSKPVYCNTCRFLRDISCTPTIVVKGCIEPHNITRHRTYFDSCLVRIASPENINRYNKCRWHQEIPKESDIYDYEVIESK